MDQIEQLIYQLVQRSNLPATDGFPLQLSQDASTSNDSNGPAQNTPRSTNTRRWLSREEETRLGRSPLLPPAVSEDLPSRCRSLSSYLHSVLPDPSTVESIMTQGRNPFAILRQSERSLHTSRQSSNHLSRVGELSLSTAHPIFLARKLIEIALCLQQLDVNTSGQPIIQLDRSVWKTARRYGDLAHLVTSQDALVSSVDGLDTLILESGYNVHLGNWHSAWLTIRRALSIAQLIGLSRRTGRTSHREHSIWFRLFYADRFLSLMMGMPVSMGDENFVSARLLESKAAPERLECIHVATSGRIIKRNVRMQRRRYCGVRNQDTFDDYRETQDISNELKQAARNLPTNWWAPPSMDFLSADSETVGETTRFLAQMHQSYLVILLHQPYVIQGPGLSPMTTELEQLYTHSKLATLSASREVLSRFLLLHKSRRAPASISSLGPKAFTASVALLLVHLHEYRSIRPSMLEHQRPYDLGVVHSVVDSMEELFRLKKHNSNAHEVQILKKLLHIEADAATDTINITISQEATDSDENLETRSNVDELAFSIPYFGMISIVRQQPQSHQVNSTALHTNRTGGHLTAESITTGPKSSESSNKNRSINLDSSSHCYLPILDSQLQQENVSGEGSNSCGDPEMQRFSYTTIHDLSLDLNVPIPQSHSGGQRAEVQGLLSQGTDTECLSSGIGQGNELDGFPIEAELWSIQM